MNDDIISENKNYKFNSFRGFDLQDLITSVENYYLEYRDSLNLPSYVTFGTEIEYEKIPRFIVNNFLKKEAKKNEDYNWTNHEDGSLKSGGEIKSPIMNDKIKYWLELQKICEFLTKNRADTLSRAGGHIHIGHNILDDDVEAWKLFLKIYTSYECVLYRFMLGDKMSARRGLIDFAKPVSSYFYNRMEKIDVAKNIFEILWMFPKNTRYLSLNFQNVSLEDDIPAKHTIEFRGSNATANEVIWQNNINTYTKVLLAAKEKNIDVEFLNYKIENEFIPFENNQYYYNEVNLKNALEFVDLVFNNNLDKTYFLRQYIKNFENNYGATGAIKAKKFVK